jgi:[acyl-carrier-protein] S-malonyltransferase
MQEAVPAGEGAMAAILGLAPEVVSQVCAEASEGEIVSPANFNSPEQTVIAGHAAAVGRASKLALQHGAMRAVPLPVSAPFHCALMRPAEARLAEHLLTIPFEDPVFPVVVNADAAPVATGAAAREALVRQVCSPVRWVESIRSLRTMGAGRFIEVGPGRVLTGLMRRIDRAADARGVEDKNSLEALLSHLGIGSAPGEAPAPDRLEENRA